MISSKGFFQVIFRVILLALFGFGISYSYLRTEYIVTPLIFVLFLLTTIIELYWYLRRQEREWSRFLESIKHHDFARNYENLSSSDELKGAYDLITKAFESLKREQQSEQIFLQTVIKHIPIGLACFDGSGNPRFTNPTFLHILERSKSPKLSQIESTHPLIWKAIVSQSNEEIVELGKRKVLVKKERIIEEESYQLISLTDIANTLDGYELDSYQKLLSILTHEIMNSSTPILSLIQVVNNKVIKNNQLIALDEKSQSNIVKSLKAIEERTGGMLDFVQSYRKINRPIKPKLSKEKSRDLLDQIISLKELQAPGGILVKDQYNGTLTIDKPLIIQVLVNLITNAQQATSEIDNSSVAIKIHQEGSEVLIDVLDNGPGVKPENTHKIFIPFFTTKPTGSGVGLALSRKIIKAHGGRIQYLRNQEDLSCFRIFLPLTVVDK